MERKGEIGREREQGQTVREGKSWITIFITQDFKKNSLSFIFKCQDKNFSPFKSLYFSL